MKDNKIDAILDKYINIRSLDNTCLKAKKILGEAFFNQMKLIYEDDYASKMADALNLFQLYIREQSEGKNKKTYKQILLKSFADKPKLDVFSRKVYVDAYMFCQSLENCFSSYEEEVTKKTILWYENYKDINPEEDMQMIYLIASDAIENQVYTSAIESVYNQSNKNNKKLSISLP